MWGGETVILSVLIQLNHSHFPFTPGKTSQSKLVRGISSCIFRCWKNSALFAGLSVHVRYQGTARDASKFLFTDVSVYHPEPTCITASLTCRRLYQDNELDLRLAWRLELALLPRRLSVMRFSITPTRRAVARWEKLEFVSISCIPGFGPHVTCDSEH